MEHIAQGDLVSLRAFEDDSADTNLTDCGLISKAYSAVTACSINLVLRHF